ncbi:hypothetical protein PHYC_01494 [Phycisphaerales bacterium]|nr:hypothetical protein PHYC_01494 [Phycisphaerales bacterium]
MKTCFKACVVGGLLAASGGAMAQSGTLYSNTFESRQIGAEWSAGTALDWWLPTFSTFNGRYSTGGTTLTLTQPAGPQPGGISEGSGGSGGGGGGGGGGSWLQYHLTFDLYIIDSWDGSNTIYGPDWFKVSANGQTLMRDTFGNQPGSTQTFHAPTTGPAVLGYDDRYLDSIYRQVSLTFTVPMGQPLAITWRDEGLQGLNDESWGIDNVLVTYETVPAPGALAGMAAMGLVGLRRRRA